MCYDDRGICPRKERGKAEKVQETVGMALPPFVSGLHIDGELCEVAPEVG